jgi:hypothetical protein
MRKLVIFAIILAAGTTAYPQTTRSARESKNEKGSSRSESSSRTVTRSNPKSSEARKSGSSGGHVSAPVQKSRTYEYNAKPATRSTERTSTSRSVQNEVRRPSENRTVTQPTRRYEPQTQTRTRSESVTRPEMKGGNTTTRSTVVRPENKSGNDERERINTSSANRVYRESRNTLTRDDGTIIRHNNDDVFTSRRFKLDYDNYDNLRRSDDFRREFRDWNNWYDHRHVRIINHYHNRFVPLPLEVRRVRYVYRRPVHVDLIWTPLLLHRFMYYYPTYTRWDVDFGREIETISSYDANDWVGTVKRVYGKVEEVYYSPEDENYILYMGAPFPYQDVSVVIPKHIAQSISMSPKWYFEDEHIWVVGLINTWEGKPEIVIRDEDQIRRY